MTEFNPQSEHNGTPEDVATLYSWANLHGAKYRDFSAARAQTREKARLRAEQALEEEQRQTQEDTHRENAHAEARRVAEEDYAAAIQARQQEQAHRAEIAAETAAREAERAAAHRAAQEAAEQAARLEAEEAARQEAQAAVELAAKQAARLEAEEAARQEAQAAAELAANQAAEQAARLQAEEAARQEAQAAAELAAKQAAEQAERQAQELRIQEQRAEEQRAHERAAQLAAQQVADRAAEQAALAAAQHLAQQHTAWQQLKPQFDTPLPAEHFPFVAPAAQQLPRNPWGTPEVREPAARPAWLSGEAPEAPAPYLPISSQAQAPTFIPPSSVPLAPEDTLQGSRDRLTSRWFALRGVFEGAPVQTEAIPAPQVSRVPAMAVFSLAGGVGKTSLVASLGRALSARGERVLLVDTAAFGLLPFFFGATDQRPGLLRTFNPPGVSSDAPIQMVTIDPDGLDSETPESLSGEISKFALGAGRIIVDLATASGATTRRIMRMAPLVLVPVVPDMNSVVSVSSIDAFFEHNSNPAGKPQMPFYVLNQFDASLPLHLDVREVLREQLGERLLNFALRRTPAMSEALAEGMTVMDYDPGSPLAEDFATLAGWVKSLSSPATTSYRGVRWSER